MRCSRASHAARVSPTFAAVDSNGMVDRITAFKGKVEEVDVPEKVDVIISEPMGFLLVHERMLEVRPRRGRLARGSPVLLTRAPHAT